jgi:hypothetical protein
MMSRLAAQLSPVPRPAPVFSGQAGCSLVALWVLLGFLVIALSFVSKVAVVLAVIGFWSIVVLYIRGAIMRNRRNARVERGQPAAMALWHSAWLCHRCGGVFVPRVNVTSYTPPRLVDSLVSIPEFQTHVWTAGGYADLLGKY